MSKEVVRQNQFAQADESSLVAYEYMLGISEAERQRIDKLYEGVFDSFSEGKLISGTILAITPQGVLVDVGCKSEGLIPLYEFSDVELKKFQVGEPLEVMLDQFENAEGMIVLSYEKAKALKAWDVIMRHYEDKTPITGVVTHKIKGGLSVDVGIPAFLPGSLVDTRRVKDFDEWVGQSVTALIINLNKARNNIIISRRHYMDDLQREAKEQWLSTVKVGDIVNGVVKNITDYGAFVGIGNGPDCLLHITDMSWGRIDHPREMVKIGDPITAKVLKVEHDSGRVSLGIKQFTPDPWEHIDEKIKVGDRVKGKIKWIKSYGLLVEIAKNIEGLVHISHVSWDRVTDLASRFSVGEEIEVLVISVDEKEQRIALSIKRLMKSPLDALWEQVEEQFKPGQVVEGTISNITSFGIFVNLLPGIDGLVRVFNLSWTQHVEHPKDLGYQIGQHIKTVILNIDAKNNQVLLGVKQLTENPWELVEKDYPINSIVDGEVSRINRSGGVFVRLPSGIEGLVRSSEVASYKAAEGRDTDLSIGARLRLRITSVNKEERKIGLSFNLDGDTFASKERSEETPKAASKKRDEGRQQVKTKGLLEIEIERHAERKRKEEQMNRENSSDNDENN
ncbi:MAG: 30S ribosomal protein S1 [Candidatus Babeliales bacterium]